MEGDTEGTTRYHALYGVTIQRMKTRCMECTFCMK